MSATKISECRAKAGDGIVEGHGNGGPLTTTPEDPVSRLAGGRTPAATSERTDVTVVGDESGTLANPSSGQTSCSQREVRPGSTSLGTEQQRNTMGVTGRRDGHLTLTATRTAAWLLTAVLFGPLHTAALGAGVWCFRWAWRSERQHAQRKNGLPAAAT